MNEGRSGARTAYSDRVIDLRGPVSAGGGVQTLDVPHLPSAVVDVTGGRLDLAGTSPDVVSLAVVGLTFPPTRLAATLGLAAVGGFTHGPCWGLLAPTADGWAVVVLGTESGPLPERLVVGRIHERVAERWASRVAGRTLRVVVFVEATPGLDGLDVRFLPAQLAAEVDPPLVVMTLSREELDRFEAPPAPADWYDDPLDESGSRWWDGSRWTLETH